MNGLGFSLKTEGLIKEYHIYDRPSERLKELFLKTRKHRVFRALGPLDIEVRKGETLGIIGENGAGKSTFLKLAAGVIEPSSGMIKVDGKVSSILELGTGFNPEFTGRENVLLNGALLGLSSGEVSNRMETITGFADIGEFFDMPVKMYSSGMYLRLAFSLAVHVDADIVLIDEALAVGDGAFEKKCIDRIWDLKKNGITMLYCSHSLYTVANFCDRAVWLKAGSVQGIGGTKEVISRYEDYLREKELVEKTERPVAASIDGEKKMARVENLRLFADGYQVETSVQHSSDIEVVVDFEIFEDVKVHVGFAIDRNDGLCCYADSTQRQGLTPLHGPGRGSLSILFRKLPLLGGAYKFVIFLLDETGICLFDRKESTILKVKTAEKEWGVCYMDHEWKSHL
ncbi:MAG TPA: ABC transporter ATP-binding protein [Thermodesulfovibrionales bacterium]|nr:ABC transporter ATP-binding protein [Thermodesulfovibrionales bacterium]